MKKLSKEQLIELFQSTRLSNPESSLDKILYQAFNEVKENEEDSFDEFRKLILEANGINEYEYYTKNVRPEIKEYIENTIFPQYSKNDQGHGILHIKEVIRRSFALKDTLKDELKELDDDMIYTIAGCHDWGKYEEKKDGEKHGIIAARRFINDKKMANFFNEEQRLIIKEAIEDHSSSLEEPPRNKYGELVSSADRNTRIEMVFIRSFFVGKARTPDMTIEEFLDFTFKRLSKRYGLDNPENMFLEDETYRNFLKDMRTLLQNETEFKNRYCQVNHIQSRNNKVADEQGEIGYTKMQGEERKMELKEKGKQYFEKLNPTLKQYFDILSNGNIPEFLYEYIATQEMQKQANVSVTCGSCYTNLFNITLDYSSLDHSVAVALIVYNFTKDKKQTLAGLLHDISTPAFKHCIDFMNGDHENQESTEELTTKIIADSKEIMSLLKRDRISLEEVADYHIYPIADNDTPRLAADRLEYTFSNGMGVRTQLWDLAQIEEIYKNIEVQVNEDGIEELGFKDTQVAEKFVNIMSKLSAFYISNQTTFSMQFIADIMKKMSENKLISIEDLYNLSEKEIIEKIENCKLGDIAKCFKTWREATTLKESDEYVDGVYCINGKNKRRYIVPLVRTENGYERINNISDKAKEDIDVFLNYKPKQYCYMEFDKDFGVKSLDEKQDYEEER